METKVKDNFLDRIGIPHSLIWGFVGLFLFILGSTLEASWFSSYLSSLGFSSSSVGVVFTAYGVFVMISAWFTGVGTQIFGLKNIMWAGVAIFFASSIPLVLIALPAKSYILTLVLYMVRGMAYPLFAYAFLVWINFKTDKEILGRAVSWYWIFFGLGMTVVAPFLSSLLIPVIGEIKMLLLGFVFVALGAFLALIVNKDTIDLPKSTNPLKDFTEGITIMFERPRLGISAIVKAINDFGKFGYIIVMPLYLQSFGFSTSEWLSIWGLTNIVNILSGYLFGYISDKIGWRQTVMYFGGTLCGIGTIFAYLNPKIFGHSALALFIPLAIYAVGLSAFGPLSALIPNLAPDKKGAAISVLNFGSGLSNFLAPLVVSIFIGPFGNGGAMAAIAVSYFLASFLTIFLKTPEELEERGLKHGHTYN